MGLNPAERRKALAGRVLEAAGQAKLGKGESAVRAKERNKAAKHVRDGLVAKQKERHQKQLEEVSVSTTVKCPVLMRSTGETHGELSPSPEAIVRR